MSDIANFAEPAYSLGSIQNNPALNYHHDVDIELLPEGKPFNDFAVETIAAQNAFSEERQKFDTRMTKDANLDRIEKLADSLNEATTSRRNKLDEKLNWNAAQVEEEFEAATYIKPTAQAGEIRSAFLKAGPAEREQMIKEAFAEDDRVVIGAVVDSHKITHGIRPEVLALEYDLWRQRIAPREFARLSEMKKVLGYHHNVGIGQLRYHARSKEGTLGFANAKSAAQSILASYGVAYES